MCKDLKCLCATSLVLTMYEKTKDKYLLHVRAIDRMLVGQSAMSDVLMRRSNDVTRSPSIEK